MTPLGRPVFTEPHSTSRLLASTEHAKDLSTRNTFLRIQALSWRTSILSSGLFWRLKQTLAVIEHYRASF